MYFNLFPRKLFTAILFIFTTLGVQAQVNYQLSGRIKDRETGEPLVGATVYIPQFRKGVQADIDGRYTLSLPSQSIKVIFSFIGYRSDSVTLSLDKNTVLDAKLGNAVLKEVVVSDQKQQLEKVRSSQMSVDEVTSKEVKLLPVIFGEADILKTLQLKPGVQSGGEGSSGLYVRGGGADQNLLLLDDIQIYNASHLFGFFSVFNSDAVQGVELFKGAFPAKYGGRLSSVVNVKQRIGSLDKFSVSGGIGTIASRMTIEGPIQKGKSSFLLSARRTYFDIFTRYLNKRNENTKNYTPIPNYYFYDLNAKLSYEISPRDRLYFSGYYGDDIFGFNRNRINFDFGWGNKAAVLRWNHTFNEKSYVNTSAGYTSYQYNVSNRFDAFKFTLGSGVRDFVFKTDFGYTPDTNHTITYGGGYTYHVFDIGRAQAGNRDSSLFSSGQGMQAGEYGAYISDDYTLNKNWQFNAGLRLSGYNHNQTFYYGLEPRGSVRYMLNEQSSLKLSYTRMFQYVHLVASSGASLPTDLWYPSNATVRPQRSDQMAAGYSTLLFGKKFLLTNELYYKKMQRQVDFKDGSNLFVNEQLDTTFVFGKGWSYGNEIYLEKKEGKTTGWIGYTLSWTWRQFPDINNGNKFHPRYDRRHDLSVVVMHKLNSRIFLTGTFVYGTGNAITLPEGRLLVQDLNGTVAPDQLVSVVPLIKERNSFRMNAYHRLDLGIVYKLKPKHGESDLTFSIYNAYNRLNPYFIYFDTVYQNEDGTGPITGFKAKQVSLFPVIPSLTYNFKF